jgi:hypothetical protein
MVVFEFSGREARIAFGLLVAGLALYGLYSINSLFQPICSEELQQAKKWPRLKYISRITSVDCGATTSRAYRIEVVDDLSSNLVVSFMADKVGVEELLLKSVEGMLVIDLPSHAELHPEEPSIRGSSRIKIVQTERSGFR